MEGSFLEDLRKEYEVIKTATYSGTDTREERMSAIGEAVNTYSLHHADAHELVADKGGHIPINFKDTALLDRFADLILNEELAWSHPDKMTLLTYPIMSDTQEDRRKLGRHKRKGVGMQGEAPFEAAAYFATDGRNYAMPTRRPLSLMEGMHMDEHTVPWKRDKEGNVIDD